MKRYLPHQEDLKTIEKMYPDLDRQKQLVLLKEYRDEQRKRYDISTYGVELPDTETLIRRAATRY